VKTVPLLVGFWWVCWFPPSVPSPTSDMDLDLLLLQHRRALVIHT
jgi:hypothetical protein